MPGQVRRRSGYWGTEQAEGRNRGVAARPKQRHTPGGGGGEPEGFSIHDFRNMDVEAVTEVWGVRTMARGRCGTVGRGRASDIRNRDPGIAIMSVGQHPFRPRTEDEQCCRHGENHPPPGTHPSWHGGSIAGEAGCVKRGDRNRLDGERETGVTATVGPGRPACPWGACMRPSATAEPIGRWVRCIPRGGTDSISATGWSSRSLDRPQPTR